MKCIDSITITPENVTVTKGTWCYDVTAKISPSDATCTCLTWVSYNPDVASVNQYGHICGISEGRAIISAIAQDGCGATDFCIVTVVPPVMVSSITVTPEAKTLNVGETFKPTATVSPSNATEQRVRWCSADCNIAEVNSYTGRVTAIAEGTTQIYATAVDGSGVRAACEVIVNIPIVEDTVPGLKTIKQCRVRKDMSMEDSAILKDSSGANVKLNVGETVPLLSFSTISANDRVWYRILYNGMMLYVTADDESFEEINVPTPPIPEGRDIFANPGLESNMDIRSTPFDITENIIGELAHGTTITLTSNTPQNSEWFAIYGRTTTGNYTYGWCSGKELAYYFLNTIRDCYVRTSMEISNSTILSDSSGHSVVLRADTVDSVRLWKLDKLTGGEYSDYNGNIRNDWYMVEYNGQIAYVTADSFYLFGFGEPLIDEEQNIDPPSEDNPVALPEHASDNCLEFIIDYEGKDFWPTARDDGYGNLTIGYGHVVKAGESFGTITEAEALELFSQDISSTETMVKNYSNNRNKIWNQHEYDAFVSLAYNAGTDVADVMDDIIAGIDPYIAFSKVSNANGEPSLGLWRRRMDEADIFVHGTYTREYRQKPVG